MIRVGGRCWRAVRMIQIGVESNKQLVVELLISLFIQVISVKLFLTPRKFPWKSCFLMGDTGLQWKLSLRSGQL